ncbi:MAG: helix-turn-helix transcriptional regulator, partial [Cyanobacteria bacterium J06635_15]
MVDRNLVGVEGGDPPVKKIRELLGLSQQQFATLLGVAISTISRWENRKSSPMFTPGQFKIL